MIKPSREMSDRIDALHIWFESQDISVADATRLMLASIAAVIADNATNWPAAMAGVAASSFDLSETVSSMYQFKLEQMK